MQKQQFVGEIWQCPAAQRHLSEPGTACEGFFVGCEQGTCVMQLLAPGLSTVLEALCLLNLCTAALWCS